MKILITGTTGMVGKNLLEHLGSKEHEVLDPSRRELDLSNYSKVEEYLSNHKPDLVIHCAGKVGGIQANMKNPVSFLIENLEMGKNVVLASYKTGIRRLINLSSSCMYPRDCTNPLKEDYILKGELEPTNEGYALAKIAVMRLCQYITKENNSFMYKTLIPCNLYGRHDKFDPKHSHMIPAVIMKIDEAIKNNVAKVEIWGDGTARREFMDASDVADFIWSNLSTLDEWPSIMNIGLGYDYSINDYYKTIAGVLGFKGEFFHNLDKPVGMKQKVVDVTLQKKLKWEPKINLQKGIQRTYEFFVEASKSGAVR